ncbi:MAG: sigma 54-interacting transcriptional regulator [Gemmatimonadales bacterium]
MTVDLYFGTSPRIERLLDRCARYARTRHPILIVGERGTGKSVLAERIHRESGRPGEFICKHLHSFGAELDYDSLAGHVRGAYTDAIKSRKGLVETAHRGTLFLDELGAASPGVQELLIELVDHGGLRRLGEDRHRPVDVRLVTATNEDLRSKCESGVFRADLRDRLGFMKLEIPPLRERRDEIPQLAESFLRKAAAERACPAMLRMSTAAMDALCSADWPGNIRDLKGVCLVAEALARPREVIELGDLPPDFMAPMGTILRQRHDESVEGMLDRALQEAGGNWSKAARLLGVSRATLYRLRTGPVEK